MPADPAISVLMPVYNARRYLGAAIDSILNQTFAAFEFVIVDDGSTDGSSKVLDEYAARDPRIVIVRRPNTGIVGALNDGLARCRAPLVARMDADDLSKPDRLARQVAYMDAHPECVLVGSRVTLIDPEGMPIRDWVQELDHDAIDRAHLQRGWPVVHPAVTMRTDAVRRVGGYRQQYLWLEDVDLFLRLAEVGRLANLPEPLLDYRQHFSSVVHTHVEKQATIRDALIAEACQRRGIEPLAPVPPPRMSTPLEYHTRWAWWALSSGHVATARKHALRVLAKRPAAAGSWRLALCALRGR